MIKNNWVIKIQNQKTNRVISVYDDGVVYGNDTGYKIVYDMGFGKESGDIEYTADFLCLMTRGKKELVFGNVDHEIVKLNILKSRFSKPNEVISMEFLPEYSYYKELDEK